MYDYWLEEVYLTQKPFWLRLLSGVRLRFQTLIQTLYNSMKLVHLIRCCLWLKVRYIHIVQQMQEMHLRR